jgi:hypothetical protein
MAKGAAIPIESFEVQHPLTDVTMPRLVHTHDTPDTRDGTTGPHNPTQYCIHTRIGRLLPRAQTLTHHLLQERQLGEAGAVVVRDGCLRVKIDLKLLRFRLSIASRRDQAE